MKGFKCGYCDEWHDELPLDIAFKLPVSCFSVPGNEREERIWESKYFTKIDANKFFIRGLIYIPVNDHDEDFCWGCWASVTKEVYEFIWDNWELDTSGKSFKGILDIDIATYEDCKELEVVIHLHGEEEQPTFTISNALSKLGSEQEKGITTDRVLSINHEVFG